MAIKLLSTNKLAVAACRKKGARNSRQHINNHTLSYHKTFRKRHKQPDNPTTQQPGRKEP